MVVVVVVWGGLNTNIAAVPLTDRLTCLLRHLQLFAVRLVRQEESHLTKPINPTLHLHARLANILHWEKYYFFCIVKKKIGHIWHQNSTLVRPNYWFLSLRHLAHSRACLQKNLLTRP